MRTTITVRTRDDNRVLEQLPYVHDFSSEDGQTRFSVDRADLDRTMDQLTDLGIVELSVEPASLEDMFLRVYQGANRGAPRPSRGTLGTMKPGRPPRRWPVWAA